MNLQKKSVTEYYYISLLDLKRFVATQLKIDLSTHDVRVSHAMTYDRSDHMYSDNGTFAGLNIVVTQKESK